MGDTNPDSRKENGIRNSDAYYKKVLNHMDAKEAKRNNGFEQSIQYVPSYDIIESCQNGYIQDFGDDDNVVRVKQYEMRIKNDLLAAALNHLSEEHLLVIYMKYFVEKSDQEMAKILGIKKDTVRKKKSRIIAMIREYMEGDL